MPKWLARLVELEPPSGEGMAAPAALRHYQNRHNPVLSVLAGSPQGGGEDFSAETDPTAATPPDPRGFHWSEANIARFHARRTRLLRLGWPANEAETIADRLTCRDVAGNDDRVSCADCRHLRPSRCGNHRLALLQTAELGRSLVGLLQRCPGFQPGI